MGSPEEDLVRTEILIENATIFVVFVQREKHWPFKIVNDTDVDVTIWQQVICTGWGIVRMSADDQTLELTKPLPHTPRRK